MKRVRALGLVSVVCLCVAPQMCAAENTSQSRLRLQDVAEQARDLVSLLDFLGQPLSPSEIQGIDKAMANHDSDGAASQLEGIFDQHALATLTINPERHVEVKRGPAEAQLIQNGTRAFLIKIVNQAGLVSPVRVDSPNGGPVFKAVSSSAQIAPTQTMSAAEIRDRWLQVSLLYQGPEFPLLPNDLDIETRIQNKLAAINGMSPVVPDGLNIQAEPQLSGLAVEYRILLIYSRDAGQRVAKLKFVIGKCTPEAVEEEITFNIHASPEIRLKVLDDDGRPTTASFIFRDALGRIYPNQTKRLAPDLYFEPQVYRMDGESISLPPGSFTVTYTGGPEYITQTQQFQVDAAGPRQLTFHLKRWIDPAKYGWYSGDSHIHANGCAHYADPTPGVSPEDMQRQILGEHLNVASVLNWGPDYYYQRQFFNGRQDNQLSRPSTLIHYDLEVSGFPSSGSGHPILLGLGEQDYPGARRIDEWPSWDLPVLRWAKAQQATAGFAHAGGGLALGSTLLPNYRVPPFDAPGANEYIVDVTYPNTVDFLGVGNGPFPYDLNIWYHTLNVGYRTRISGETDFPCIYDTRVGMARTYASLDGGTLTYSHWLAAIRSGASYVSDGRSHLMEFRVNGVLVGTQDSQVNLPAAGPVEVELKAAAWLDPVPDKAVQNAPFDWEPYWDLERARIGDSRKIPVELMVNGEVVAREEIMADGSVQKLKFTVPLEKSSWLAFRVVPSSHTNPIFVAVAGKPMRASRRSAEWSLAAVDQCWSQKAPQISQHDLPAAEEAYEHARRTYRELIEQSEDK